MGVVRLPIWMELDHGDGGTHARQGGVDADLVEDCLIAGPDPVRHVTVRFDGRSDG